MQSPVRFPPWWRALALAASAAGAAASAQAWNYPGHRMVNQVALAALPPDFPQWVKTPHNASRIAFLAGEPDRWRDTWLQPFRQYNPLDHFIDLEELPAAGISYDSLTPFLYDFVVRFAAGRAAHPQNFPAIDPDKDRDHSLEWCGFLPWAIYMYYAKLQVDLSVLRTFEADGGTPTEIENTKEDIVGVMALMGHFVGDGSQPLHTTIQFNGWVGPDPQGFTRSNRFHSWIDGGFIAKAGISTDELLPMVHVVQPLNVSPRADGRDPVFVAIMDYLLAGNRLVVPLYQLEKDHKLEGNDPGSAEGRAFIDAQLVRGGEMLATLWLTAWRHPTPCHFLQYDLSSRPAGTLDK